MFFAHIVAKKLAKAKKEGGDNNMLTLFRGAETAAPAVLFAFFAAGALYMFGMIAYNITWYHAEKKNSSVEKKEEFLEKIKYMLLFASVLALHAGMVVFNAALNFPN